MEEPLLQFFDCEHLPRDLQVVSESFFALARHVVTTLPRNAERTIALRKIIEGRDAALRAAVAKP